ncbi:hypothetical protein Q9S71_14690 [Microbacterium sp. KSW4-11]|uniref:Uncharacterized protein n=1 Tax=Microbacterium gawkjiense TaxID=3067309 RepID=A0ABU3GE45_9MICO|nr:hypothetical protein [Microbacterium sp. KSW4-11]MDT3318073.1 hypothetical protein [Microbacterium sp. KSW4-11]
MTTLTDAVQDRWPDLAEAYIHLQADQDRVRMVASFAHDVAIAAEAGDVVAQSITEHAAEQLAHSVRTAAKRVTDNDTTFSVCAIGGVFASVRLRDSFERSLAKDSMFQLQAPLGAGIDGSGALGRVDLVPGSLESS